MRPVSVFITCVLLSMSCAVPVASAQDERDSQHAEEARRAEEAGELERALKLYERAYIETRDPYYIYHRVLIYERMGRKEDALIILDEHRDALEQDERIDDLAIVEQRLRRSEGDASVDASASRAPSGAGVVLMSSGAALTLVGAVGLIAGRRRGAQLQCAPGAAGVDARDCAGVDARAPATLEAWEREWRIVRGLEVGGWSGIITGAGLVGLGAITRARRATPAASSSRAAPAFGLAFSREGAALSVFMSF